ncbi:acyltransferase family protein [Streptomyces sp. NPDC002917]|uniref:acyltransferase family protein n=1 Tax=unclassified Streptomyces TaxID=2593676 RepID=UPI002E80A7EB|nr:acyltransferase [Streptomyces sp. NBC_00562]WTD30996.1 acyltransferase [Streptomyces sp. NBC_01643]WUC17660.1 acyltransferase [Streptomyces sp. NBC_00562]
MSLRHGSGPQVQDRSQSSGSIDPSRPQRGQTRLAAIDGLRLVAALMVAGYHYLGTPTPHFWGEIELRDFAPFLHEISRYGWLGVEFFFIISGFVICMSCWGRTPAQFTVSRISRLFPAYWCAVLLVVVLVLAARMGHWPAATRIDPRTVLGNLTMVPGPLGLELVSKVSWTLWVEARFYLLMAVLLISGLSYRRMVAFCGAWLLAGVIALEVHSPLLNEFVLSRYTGLFVAGIVLHLMRRFGQNLLLWLLLGFAWCYELTVLEFRVADHVTTSSSEGRPSWAVCATILTLCLGLLALAGVGPLAGLQWRWLVTAGGLTYPFYLVHQSIGIPLAKGLIKAVPGLGLLPSMAVSVICMLGLSALIHKRVEHRFGRLLRNRLTFDVHLQGLAPGQAFTARGSAR